MAMLASAVTREKSPEAFRTISEVAVDLDIPQHVLRFWESRFSQVRPVKRAGGRRYYRPEDVDLLRGIRTLLYREGFTIKGAQKVIRDKGQRHVAELGRTAFAGRAPVRLVEENVASAAAAEEPRYARAALAIVERAHAEPAPVFLPEPAVAEEVPAGHAAEPVPEQEPVAAVQPAPAFDLFSRQVPAQAPAEALAGEEHARLEQLLAELLQWKSRLAEARAR
jgi:DNA-binding transcriptional MerR regulator